MEINFYEINFHVDKFARISRFLGVSAKFVSAKIVLFSYLRK